MHVPVDEARRQAIRDGNRRVGQRQAQRPVGQHVQDAADQGHAHQRADLPVGIQGRRRAVRMLLAGHPHHGGRHGGYGDADSHVHHSRAQRQPAIRRARAQAHQQQGHDSPHQQARQHGQARAMARRDTPRQEIPYRIGRHHRQQAQARLQGIGAARLLQEQAQ
jgi:hypothetical protein